MTLKLAENVGAKAGTYGRDALYALAGKIFWMDMNRVAFGREFADSHCKRLPSQFTRKVRIGADGQKTAYNRIII